MSRREQAIEMTKLLPEPARTRVLEALATLQCHGVSRPDLVSNLVRAHRVSSKLAMLLAFEAVEWKTAGSVRLGVPKVWCSWFRIETFGPEDVDAMTRLLADEEPRRYRLLVFYGSEDARHSSEMSGALETVRRELEAHLGAPVKVCEVGP